MANEYSVQQNMFFTCSVHLLSVTHNNMEDPSLLHSSADNMKAVWAGFLQQAGIIFCYAGGHN